MQYMQPPQELRYYRRPQRLLPMQHLRKLWRVFASAFVACWFGLVLWFSWSSGSLLRLYMPPQSGMILASLPYSSLAVLVYVLFFVVLGVWVLVQTVERWQAWNLGGTMWNLICLFSIPDIVLFSFSQRGVTDVTVLVLLYAFFMALLVERGGAMLVSIGRRQKKPLSLLPALVMRLFAFAVIAGMGLFCLASSLWFVTLWNLLPRFSLLDLGLPIILVVDFVMMVLALAIALFALVRSALVLRTAYAPAPKS